MRVHILAKELNVASKDIIAKCRAEGIDAVKNHMSTLSAGLHATIIEWFSEGSEASALETATPVDLEKVRAAAKKRKRKSIKEEETAEAETGVVEVAGEVASRQAVEVVVAVAETAEMESGAAAIGHAIPVAELRTVGQPAGSAPAVAEVTLPETGESSETPPSPATPPEPSETTVATEEPTADGFTATTADDGRHKP